MNDHDWAVVIGISRYADADPQPSWITNLNGPENDAVAIAEWLERPEGGGLPSGQVNLIHSSAPAPPPAGGVGPVQAALIQAFEDLLSLPTTAYNDQYAGRRLYVYVSGHGLAQQDQDAAVVTAEATVDDALNVLVTSWLQWLWYAARFKEFVLWVDTCETRATPPLRLYGCERPRQERTDAGTSHRFYAYAAPYNYSSVEAELDGQWHGVFTHALLKGLNGANGTPVRAQGLKEFLINSMKTFMTPAQLENPRVWKEPAFGVTDDFEFSAPAEQLTFPATLHFPEEAVGERVTISVEAASPLLADTILDEQEWTPDLPVGAYVAYVPALDLKVPFQVTGGGTG